MTTPATPDQPTSGAGEGPFDSPIDAAEERLIDRVMTGRRICPNCDGDWHLPHADYCALVTPAAPAVSGDEALRALVERTVAQRLATAKAEGAREVRERVEAVLADLDRGNGYRGTACGVCSGHSPSWDGHSRNCKRALPDRIRAALRSEGSGQ